MTRLALTDERIVVAALALADEAGPQALSMRRLGSALGCDASALYRHVPSKQALLDAVADRVLEAVDLPPARADPWQELREIALAVRQAVSAHPRLAPLLAARPPLGPAAQRIVERLLSSLARAGLGPREAAQALQLLVTLTLGTLGDATRTDAGLSASRQQHVVRALRADPGQAPLSAAAAAFLARNDDVDHFAFSVDVVLTGLAQRVAPS